MSKKVFYISDFFVKHVLGGSELNDDELIKILEEGGFKTKKVQSHMVTKKLVQLNSDHLFIISNFINLTKECKDYISENISYIIYEHDHKYLQNRNPALCKNFKAKSRDLRNLYFFKNALSVVCQSSLHKKIIYDNLNLNNLINFSGNLWSLGTLELIRELSKNKKSNKCSILDSSIPHKNTRGAVLYAKNKNFEYELISDKNYRNFLGKISQNEKFIFLPKTPETLSRILVEARMLGCKVITNELVGAAGESWFGLKGEELIDRMIEKRKEALNNIKYFYKKSRKTKPKPLISIISTFHRGEKYLNHFMENMVTQTYFNKCELVLIDAGSPGEERNIIKPYLDKYDNIAYHRLEENLRPTPCINKAIKLAKGKVLTFACIDDVKEEKCIEDLFSHLESNDCSLVYGDVVETDIENQYFKEADLTKNTSEHSQEDFSKENMVKCLPGPMPMWYGNVHDSCGLFDDLDCNYADDWEMWLRMTLEGYKFKKLNKKVGLYLIGGRSQKSDNIEQRKEEAKIFFKYSQLFGKNYKKYKPYFEQFTKEEQ